MTLAICSACKQSGKEVVALYKIRPSKGGDWYLCGKHADVVTKSLLGRMYEMQEIKVNDRQSSDN